MWWEKPRTNQELWHFGSDELLAHRTRVVELIEYWKSGRLPRSPFSADESDAALFAEGLGHELYELNRELARRGYTAIRIDLERAH